ncbi:MAG: NifU N-terminal domain-containing protein [Planctomycetales bacterium]|nr:NifU N-terminal domain-containing protein [Planctomycetales bacterium]
MPRPVEVWPEPAANPAAWKFVTNRRLVEAGRTWVRGEDGDAPPVVRAVLSVPNVVSVYARGDFLTALWDGQGNPDLVIPAVSEAIRRSLA